MPKKVDEETPAAAEPVEAPKLAPAVQVSVREWAIGQAELVGQETALAFAATFGRDTATADELERALAEWRARIVHQEP